MALSAAMLISAMAGCSSSNSDATSSGTESKTTDFPQKQISLIVPYSAGGGADRTARAFAQEMQNLLGKPVIVTNKTGAAGAIGLEFVKRSDPDGYTMAYLPVKSTFLKAEGTTQVSIDDFRPIGRAMIMPASLVVRKDAKWNTIEEFVNDAKDHPGEFKIGNPGAGSNLGDSGDLKVLAMLSEERSNSYPDIPTAKEAGYDVDIKGWAAFGVPKDTPDDVVKALEDAANKAINSDTMKKVLETKGFDFAYLNGSDMQAEGQKEMAKYTELISKLDITTK